ncbi:E3 ubiquitin-protein ligase PUB23-like [Curcuma longa]|uniref:E3 ubiquitin-protein ligase PUB23-like n=1 Tax=Curcuma longa TaxID=136217 RepID=UPI003D9E8AE5
MEGLEIPSYYLCPISLEMMRDPVTLPTGITYDRQSIERWLFDSKRSTCPVTKQLLSADAEVTPNHTLRRLIQAWCTLHSSDGVERIPTPKLPVGQEEVAALLEASARMPTQLDALRKLRRISGESERNRRCVAATPGAVDALARVIVVSASSDLEIDQDTVLTSSSTACDEALAVLHSLQISEEALLDLVTRNGDLVGSLTSVLQRSNYQSRSYAMLILKSVLTVVSPGRLTALPQELFDEVVGVIRDGVSPQATRAALRVLAGACPWGRNRAKAVKAGAVHATVELLLEEPERRACEAALAALASVCGCAEGRAELVRHRAAVAVVSKKILRVSQLASEKAVRVLHEVVRHAATAALLQEMVQVGAVTKLCVVVQAGGGGKMEERAREILRMHAKAWRDSPCLSSLFKNGVSTL